MTRQAYDVRWSKSARRAIAERLPSGIAEAAIELVTGTLCANPRRLGKALGDELVGIYSARLARDWRVLYEIDEATHVVVVLDIRHRAVAYRSH